MTSNLSNPSSFNEYGGLDEITLGDGSGFPIIYIGSSTLHSNNKSFALNNVLHAPALNKNFISVFKFCKTNDDSLEFFFCVFHGEGPSHMRASASRDNLNDIYHAPASLSP